MGTLLFILGATLFATYWFLFVRTLRAAGSDATQRYQSEVAKPRLNLIGVCLLGAALLVPAPLVAGIFATCAVAWVVFGTFTQRRRMRELQFDKSFSDRLFAASFVVATSIACLLAGKLWYQVFAA